MTEIKFSGRFDKACESKNIDLSVMGTDRLPQALFEKLWKLYGGSVEGEFKNTYQHGGISLEEIIIPISILEPK